MKSHEALKIACGEQNESKIAPIAKRLLISKYTLYKWTEPAEDLTDSGSRNPLDTIEYIIESAMALGIPQCDAYAPLYYLNERFKLLVVPMPDLSPSTKEIVSELTNTIKEFSEFAKEVSKSMENDDINKLEAKRIEKEGMDLVRQAMKLIAKAKEMAK